MGGESSSDSSSNDNNYDEDNFADEKGFTEGFSSPTGAGNQAVAGVSPGGAAGIGGGGTVSFGQTKNGIPTTTISLPSGTFSQPNVTPVGGVVAPSVSLPSTAFGQPTTSEQVMAAVRGMPVEPTVTNPAVDQTSPFSNVNTTQNRAGFQNQVQQAYDQAKSLTSTPFAGGTLGLDIDSMAKGVLGLQYSREFNQGGEVKSINKGIGALYKK